MLERRALCLPAGILPRRGRTRTRFTPRAQVQELLGILIALDRQAVASVRSAACKAAPSFRPLAPHSPTIQARRLPASKSVTPASNGDWERRGAPTGLISSTAQMLPVLRPEPGRMSI